MRRSSPVPLTDEEIRSLRRWIGDRKTPSRVRLRARILLGASAGRPNREIARTLGVDPATVSFWRLRFQNHRLEGGLEDARRPGRRTVRTAEVTDRVLHATYHELPETGTRWTTRTLAGHLGVNHMLVHRVWKAHGVVVSGEPANRLAGGPPRSNLRIDLFGVLLEPARRAVVFGVGGSPGETLLEPEEPIPTVLEGISGGFLFRPGSSDGTELLTILDRMEPFVGRTDRVEHERHDLITLLRDIGETAGSATEIHVFAENPTDEDAERLADWVKSRPQYVLHGFASGGGWRQALQDFVRRWSTASIGGTGLFGVPLFVTAAARFAAGSSSGDAGLVWSLPLASVASAERPEGTDVRKEDPVPSRGAQSDKTEPGSDRPGSMAGSP